MTITVPVWAVLLLLVVLGVGGCYLLLRFSGDHDSFTPFYAYGWGLICFLFAAWLALTQYVL